MRLHRTEWSSARFFRSLWLISTRRVATAGYGGGKFILHILIFVINCVMLFTDMLEYCRRGRTGEGVFCRGRAAFTGKERREWQ